MQLLTPRLFTAGAFAATALVAGFVASGERSASKAGAVAPIPTITITSVVPSDLPTAAPAATLQQAAGFAWQEFIALNWAAVPQKGLSGQRDTANTNCAFGQTAGSCAGPLVWETFRGKVEIYPGNGSPPPGYPNPAPPLPTASVVPSYPPNAFGYDALPQYNYAPQTPPPTMLPNVGPCSGTPPASTAWINLDETDQITLDAMYAGSAPASAPNNSSPKLIRFLAKANRTLYNYIAANKWWGGGGGGNNQSPAAATVSYVKANNADPTPGSTSLVSLPNGTIEVKAGWRLLGPTDIASRYHLTTARYYETKNGVTCYNQATFGLVALHIIQKTPSAPYFVYATFEQADNIVTASGQHVEDDDGRIIATPGPCAPGQAAPCPLTPAEVLLDSPNGFFGSKGAHVALAPTPPAPTPPFCTVPGKRIYFQESSNKIGLPRGGNICVNQRENSIPPQIIAVNAAAHAAIAKALAAKGIANSPFQHYKLINVQYVPIDKTTADGGMSPPNGLYGGNNPNTGMNRASFYLANGVVETDRGLQLFSGGLSPATGAISDFAKNFGEQPPPLTHKNTAYAGHGYDMGGCMGCHGSQGQHQGGNFSVITAVGAVAAPEVPPMQSAHGPAPFVHNRRLIKY
jgi:hypothetical protein